jgi:hypothetical protein
MRAQWLSVHEWFLLKGEKLSGLDTQHANILWGRRARKKASWGSAMWKVQ